MKQLKARTLALAWAWSCAALAAPALAQGTVYRCPGTPVVYTDQISAKEANEKGCRTIEGAPITVMQTRQAAAGAGQRRARRRRQGLRGAISARATTMHAAFSRPSCDAKRKGSPR